MVSSISASSSPSHSVFRSHWLSMLLVMLFVAIALWLSISIPIFEGPDENEHFTYMTSIAHERRLPTYSLEVVPDQKIQPPLYYAFGALLVGWVPLNDLDGYLVRNPHATFSRVDVPGNKNVFIHARDENWPFRPLEWNGTKLAVYLFRWLSVALGVGTVIATYLLALETFKGERWLALGAMSLVAFNPQFVYLSSLINTDNAVAMLSTTGLLLTVYILNRPPSLKRVVWLGLIAGLAGLAKVTGLGVLGIGLIVVTVVAWRQRSMSYWLLACAILLALAMAISGWWYARNWWLYGDPFLGNILEHHFSEHPELSTLGDWIAPYLQAEVSYWAVFGWLNITVPEIFYRVFSLFSRIGLIGLLSSIIRWLLRRPLPVRVEAVGLLLLWTTLILAGLANYVRVFGGLQGRHYFPAICSVSILLVLGWISLLPSRFWAWFCGGLAVIMPILSVALPVRFMLPRYAPPPAITTEQIPPTVRQPMRYYGDSVALVGAEVEPGPSSPGQRVRVTLYWQALKQIEVNYSVFVHLLDREGQVVGQSNSYPAQGRLATSLWRSGEVIVDTHEVFIDWDVITPVVARVDVGLYRFESPGQAGPRPLDEAGHPTLAIVGLTKIIPAEWPATQPSVPFNVRFDDGILFTGYDLTCAPKIATAKDTLFESLTCNLTLYWDVTRPPRTDYQVFIQLWAYDQHVTGFDGPPVGGNYPTSWWDIGETIQDTHTFELSTGLPPGDCRWLVGLYQLETGIRLPAYTAGGTPLPDNAITFPCDDDEVKGGK